MRTVEFIKPSEMSQSLVIEVWQTILDAYDTLPPGTETITLTNEVNAGEARRLFMTEPSKFGNELVSRFDVFGLNQIQTFIEVALDPAEILSCKVITY